MMTGKEVLEKISTKQVAIELFNIVSNGKYDMNDLVSYFDRIDKAINELEELKRDVKRFMELYNPPQPDDEYDILRVKLSKVGKEE